MTVLSRWLRRWWLQRQINLAVLFGRQSRAISLLRQMVSLNRRDRVAQCSLAVLLAENGDSAGARDELRSLVAENPDYADGWFNLGYVHDQRDELVDAEHAFRQAVSLKPSLDRAWYGLGLVLIRAGRLDAAVDALKRNTVLQPFSPYGWYQLGMTYHHLGQAGEALKVYEHLKKFEPRYAATLKRDIDASAQTSTASAYKGSHDAFYTERAGWSGS